LKCSEGYRGFCKHLVTLTASSEHHAATVDSNRSSVARCLTGQCNVPRKCCNALSAHRRPVATSARIAGTNSCIKFCKPSTKSNNSLGKVIDSVTSCRVFVMDTKLLTLLVQIYRLSSRLRTNIASSPSPQPTSRVRYPGSDVVKILLVVPKKSRRFKQLKMFPSVQQHYRLV